MNWPSRPSRVGNLPGAMLPPTNKPIANNATRVHARCLDPEAIGADTSADVAARARSAVARRGWRHIPIAPSRGRRLFGWHPPAAAHEQHPDHDDHGQNPKDWNAPTAAAPEPPRLTRDSDDGVPDPGAEMVASLPLWSVPVSEQPSLEAVVAWRLDSHPTRNPLSAFLEPGSCRVRAADRVFLTSLMNEPPRSTIRDLPSLRIGNFVDRTGSVTSLIS